MRRQVELRISLFDTIVRNVACVQLSLQYENIVRHRRGTELGTEDCWSVVVKIVWLSRNNLQVLTILGMVRCLGVFAENRFIVYKTALLFCAGF